LSLVLRCVGGGGGLCVSCVVALKVEFLLKTESGYPRDAEVALFILAKP